MRSLLPSLASLLVTTAAFAQPMPVVDETKVAPRVIPSDQMLEVTGSLSLRVQELDEAVASLETLLPSLGARLRDRRDTELVFEVERARYAEAMDRVSALGVELDRSVDMVDRTPEYIETLALLRSAQQTRNRIGSLHQGTSGVKDPLTVEGALRQWDDRIAGLDRALKRISRVTDNAIVRVSFQPTVGVIRDEVPSFELPFPWLAELELDRLLDLESHGEPEPEDDDESVSAAAQMDLHLKVHRASEEVPFGGNETAASAGMTMRGVGETTPVGFAAGMDLELGGGFSGGFLYEYRLLAGLGTGISEYVAIGVVSGIGIGGLTGDHVPFGLDIPVEVFAGVELGGLMRVSSWARSSWILASEDRQDGSEAAPFGDELAAGGSLLFGGRTGSYSHDRTGLAISGAYRELMGTHVYEASIGFGLSFLELQP